MEKNTITDANKLQTYLNAKEHVIKQLALGNSSLLIPWKPELQDIIIEKVNAILQDSNKKYPYIKEYSEDTFQRSAERVYDAIRSFDYPPFTIQRLCEILLEPNTCQIKNTNVYMRRLVKMVSVTSTINHNV